MASKHDEMILAIRTQKLFTATNGRGIKNDVFIAPFDVLDIKREDVVFAHRRGLETNYEYRQIIPYVVLRSKGRVVVYQRTKEASEKRLHDKWSLGFGGHINLGDCVHENGVLDVAKTIHKAAKREVNEEVSIDYVYSYKTVGLLIVHKTEVDRVHVGVVQFWDVSGQVLAMDSELHKCQFKDVDQLGDIPKWETWSEMVIQHLEVN